MKANIINGKIELFGVLPMVWNNRINFRSASVEILESEGFYDVVEPEYNSETHKLSSIFFDETLEVFTYQLEELPPLTQDEILETNMLAITAKYEEHKSNGWNAYQQFRAKVVLNIEAEIITEDQAFLIEHVLAVAYNRIANTGDWKTARYELSLVTGYDAFIEPYYNEAMTVLNDYINENYD